MEIQSIIQLATVAVAIFGSATLRGWRNAKLVEQIDKRIEGVERRLDNRIDLLERRIEDRIDEREKRIEQSEQHLIARLEDLKDRFTDVKELVVGWLEIRKV